MNNIDKINKNIEEAQAKLDSAKLELSKLKDEQNVSSGEFMPIPEGIQLSGEGIIVNNGRTIMKIDCGLIGLDNFKTDAWTVWTDYTDKLQLKKVTFSEIVKGDRILACSDKSEYSDLIYWYVIDEELRAYWYDERIRTSIYESNIKTYNELWKVVSKE